MKRHLIAPLAAIVLGFLATSASAGITVSQLVSLFHDKGYSNIQVSTAPGQMIVEATQNGMQVQVTYDVNTGQIVRQRELGETLKGIAAKADTSGDNTGKSGSGDDQSETEDSGSHHHRLHRSGGDD